MDVHSQKNGLIGFDPSPHVIFIGSKQQMPMNNLLQFANLTCWAYWDSYPNLNHHSIDVAGFGRCNLSSGWLIYPGL